ncbi:L,D-transpeptidase family protein [Ferrimicrobium acidiphilum]|uniref:L,D-transpeptidase family protein n=1 Tax=Ferrimicrobium acidiphilum TaxID=121039 RepID=UPI0023F03D11|nr:L,D-transpeptidase family protein [Ferrimicrobium acidiphilum]
MDFSRKIMLLGVGVLVVLLVAVGIVVVPSLNGSSSASLASNNSTASNASTGANVVVASVTPNPGATNVRPNEPITIHFSTPINSHTPMPTLSPPVAGSWFLENSTTVEFAPDASYTPGGTESVSIPGGPSGILAASGQRLQNPEQISFTIAQGSLLRMQQLLAQLNYLPDSFKPTHRLVSNADLALVQEGNFNVRWSNEPSSLQATFYPGSWGVATQAAIMSFEKVSNLPVNGQPSATVWSALLAAAAQHQLDPNAYSYIYVSKSPLPETLKVWVNGKVVLTSVCNTGVGADVTHAGTWPIFLRYVQNYMSGTNLNGTTYHVLVHWINYFHGSVAVHGYPRATYGYPQSAGCVELPISTAKVVYGMVNIGTMVTVL